ncbi:MAG: cyclodeaminase/cyclohydrolase family protein, partial [Planctomycetes bacterium]|nr:cyclodeaminase/cyclohydrolase family protein [Planctomycetota bacterium]
LRDAIDADAAAFGGFAKVYAMPKTTPEEKAARAAKMQETLKAAMAVPLQVMETAAFCLEFVPRLAACGNTNLITDAGVAGVLLEAAARAARLNVLVNLKFIKDEGLQAATRARVAALADRAAALAAETAAIVEKSL